MNTTHPNYSLATRLPIAIVGGGPVGLTAAAQLVRRGLPFVLLEAGAEVGAAVRQWGHVGMFSPWRYAVDRTARELLESVGWQAPPAEELPSGHALVDRYVAPLAAHPAIAPHIRLGSRVVAISRRDFDKVRTKDRDRQPFELRLESGAAVEASAVIDASGTWMNPNPAGAGGLAVNGEGDLADVISYGIPDISGAARTRFAGQRVVVVGSGHSAFNVILDLLKLNQAGATTEILWVMRRDNLESLWGGGSADSLEARGRLGVHVKQAADAGDLKILSPFRIRSVARRGGGIALTGVYGGVVSTIDADQMVVCTGFRPDLAMLREIRLGIDPWLECTAALGPLIDPNEHSCGTVRPHGARELAHPEKDFFIVGMKSYGRAPTFLLATGYEQSRSVVAFLAGDFAAADRVELELPETGVCNTGSQVGSGCCGGESPAAVPVSLGLLASAESGCCGGPAPAGVEACCVTDADAKAAGKSGCGCS